MATSDRDRYADFLRLAAIALVVVGHWLELLLGRLRDATPWAPWATWLFQVMPLFFLVGGFANGRSWRRARDAGEAPARWVRRRARRLVAPLVPLVLLWAILVPALVVAGIPLPLLQEAIQGAFVPTWFLAAYLTVIAVAPWTWRLHERHRARVVLALAALAFLVDALGRAGVPRVTDANVLVVWLAIHQLGYFWRDPRLPRGAGGLALAALALAALLALTAFAGYAVSMVNLFPGEPNNVNRPTAALVLLALAQLGVVTAARAPAERWLARPGAARALGALGGVALTVFLWHMSAIVLTGGLAYALGRWPEAPDLDPARWTVAPAWMLVALGALVLLVLTFRGAERPSATPTRDAPVATFVGLAATIAGVTWLAGGGLYGPGARWSVSALALGAIFVGLALVGAWPRARASPNARGE